MTRRQRLKLRTCAECEDFTPAIGRVPSYCAMFGITTHAGSKACASATPKPGAEQLELIHRRERP